MLVLSRKVNQTIRIGQTVEVKVLATRGDTVKLGFIGPPEIAIHREEIYRRIERGTKKRVRVPM